MLMLYCNFLKNMLFQFLIFSFAINHTHHLDCGLYPLHGPPHIIPEGTHHQHATHNSYANLTIIAIIIFPLHLREINSI